MLNLDYSNIGRLIWKVRNCIMAKRILKTSIEMMCLGDPNEMNFYKKCGLQYEFFFLWSKCNLNMNVLFITSNASRDDP